MNISKKAVIVSVTASFILSGCYNQPGLVEDKSYDRTKTGVAAGAVTGALIGSHTGSGNDRGRRALYGGLIGAVAGGVIGYSMDQQANEIANALGTGVENDPLAALDPNREIIVSKTSNYVKIIFRDSMMFATNSSTLQSSARQKVQKVAKLLENYPQTVVSIAGFTDDRGSYAYNQKLSEKRAKTVADILAVNGYPHTQGCSYSNPIAPNDSSKNRALNRRVEVYLYGSSSALKNPCQ